MDSSSTSVSPGSTRSPTATETSDTFATSSATTGTFISGRTRSGSLRSPKPPLRFRLSRYAVDSSFTGMPGLGADQSGESTERDRTIAMVSFSSSAPGADGADEPDMEAPSGGSHDEDGTSGDSGGEDDWLEQAHDKGAAEVA